MIETREALGIIDDILAVPGIDGIFIGPSDLSLGLSEGRDLNPVSAAVEEALDHAVARSRVAGKVAGIFAGTGERAAAPRAVASSSISVSSDGGMLRAGAAAALKLARGE